MHGIVEKMRHADHNRKLTTHSSPFKGGGSAKGEGVNGSEGRNKKVIDTIYFTRLDVE